MDLPRTALLLTPLTVLRTTMEIEDLDHIEAAMISSMSIDEMDAMPQSLEEMTREQALRCVANVVGQAEKAVASARSVLGAAGEPYASEVEDAKAVLRDMLARPLPLNEKPDEQDLECLGEAIDIAFEVLIAVPVVPVV